MNFIVTQEIKSPVKVAKGIYIFDFFFLIAYIGVSLVLSNLVNGALFVPFLAFSFIMAIYLVSSSWANRKRRNYQSIILFIRKDRTLYRPIPNLSKKREEGENR